MAFRTPLDPDNPTTQELNSQQAFQGNLMLGQNASQSGFQQPATGFGQFSQPQQNTMGVGYSPNQNPFGQFSAQRPATGFGQNTMNMGIGALSGNTPTGTSPGYAYMPQVTIDPQYQAWANEQEKNINATPTGQNYNNLLNELEAFKSANPNPGAYQGFYADPALKAQYDKLYGQYNLASTDYFSKLGALQDSNKYADYLNSFAGATNQISASMPRNMQYTPEDAARDAYFRSVNPNFEAQREQVKNNLLGQLSGGNYAANVAQQLQTNPMLQDQQHEQQALFDQISSLPQYQSLQQLSGQIGPGGPTAEQKALEESLRQQLRSSPAYAQMSGYLSNALGAATAAPQPDVFATSPAVRRPPMMPTGPRGVSSRRREPGQVRTQMGRDDNEDRENNYDRDDRIRPLSGMRSDEERYGWGSQSPRRAAGQQMPSNINNYRERLQQLAGGRGLLPRTPGESGIGSLFRKRGRF